MFYRFCTATTLALLMCAGQLSAQNPDAVSWLQKLKKDTTRLGISEADLQKASINRLYTDQKTGITYIYLQQNLQQAKVIGALLSLAVKGGQLVNVSGRFLPIDYDKVAASRTRASVEPVEAVRIAAKHLDLQVANNLRIRSDRFAEEKKYLVAAEGLARQDVRVEQCWHLTPGTHQLKLVWNVSIDDAYSDDYWQVRIDAMNGDFVDKNNLTIYEREPVPADNTCADKTMVDWTVDANRKHQRSNNFLAPIDALYRVYPFPVRSPDQAEDGVVANPWTMFGPGNPATTLGWHSTADTDYNITRGNNVFTYLNITPNDLPDAVNNWPDTSTTPAPALTFDHLIDFSKNPYASTENKKFALDNLFYWNNLLHDVTYQYGFTETAGNFQSSNLGRGGEEGDHVLAQCQDFRGKNNANFSTPEDGQPGRMRMYLWTNPHLRLIENGELVDYRAKEGVFAPTNKLADVGPVTGNVVMYFNSAPGTQVEGCLPDNDLAGKIAFIDNQRGPMCNFITIAANCYNAGAIGLIFYSTNETLPTTSGNLPGLTIPVISVAKSTADKIIQRVNANETVTVTLFDNMRDGSLDNTIISHEFMHGVTNRMTGGGASECLGNMEQAGEGWSDYLALMMTTDWDLPNLFGETPVGVGSYGGGKFWTESLRRYPSSTDMSINPLTYAHMGGSAIPHGTGEIWCAALWDMTWEIIAQKGFHSGGFADGTGTGGNVIAMNLVMTALKLQPCLPGFIDSRDAILAADSILYNKEFHCAIWRAFAKRGMGYGAKQNSATVVGDEKASFSMPVFMLATKDTTVQTGSTITVSHTVTSSCTQLTAHIMRDTIPYGWSYISSTPAATLLSGGILEYAPVDITPGETKTFSVTLQTFAQPCTPDTVIHDDRDGNTLGGLTPNLEAGTGNGWTTVAGGLSGQAWHAEETSTFSVINLVSQPTVLTAGKGLSILTFNHRYDTHLQFDGGVVEYSIDGVNWHELEPFFLRNPYSASMLGNVFVQRRTFSGNNGAYQQSAIDLSEFGDTPIRIRFRFASNESTAGNGWLVDDILRVNYCGARLRSGLYAGLNGQAILQSSTSLYVGISPALPLTLVAFEARQSGSNNLLQWKTESEVNVKEFDVEFSKDGTQWMVIGTVMARNEPVNHYSHTHTDPVNGANYYRLKMKDLDGSYKYSDTRIVRRQTGEIYFTLNPNPARGTAHFYFSGSLKLSTIRIYDGAGRLVKQAQLPPGSNYYEMPLGGLAPGIYVAEGVGQGGKELLRFAIQK